MNTVSILLVSTELLTGARSQSIIVFHDGEDASSLGNYTTPSGVLLPGESPTDGASRVLLSTVGLDMPRRNILLWDIKNTDDTKHWLFYTNVSSNKHIDSIIGGGAYNWPMLLQAKYLKEWPMWLVPPDRNLELYIEFDAWENAS